MQPLSIPKGKAIPGLHIHCNKCKTIVSKRVVVNGKEQIIVKCDHYDRQVYKALIYIPGSKNKHAPKVLPTRDIDEAVKLTLDFAKEVARRSEQPEEREEKKKITKPTLLVACLRKYLDWLQGIGAEEHEKKTLSKRYVEEVARSIKYMLQALHEKKYNLDILHYNELTKKEVGIIHSYFLNTLKFKPKTYNKYMGILKAFYTWLIDVEEYETRNPFSTLVYRTEDEESPDAIEWEEMEAVIKAIGEVSGHKTYTYNHNQSSTRQAWSREYNEPWLIPALLAFYYIGGRREEMALLKCSDVKEDRFGNIQYFRVENRKVNKIQAGKQKKKRVYHMPYREEMGQVLKDLGYFERRGTDEYLIAPDCRFSRDTLHDYISRAFSHYYKKVFPDGKKCLKSLRKAAMTWLDIQRGRNVEREDTKTHSSQRTLDKHYIDTKQVAKEISKKVMQN